MWPAKRNQPRPRSPACAGKAAHRPFPQQKPPFGAVFLWAADGSRLMPPAAKVPVCLRLFGRGHRAYEQRRPTGLAGARVARAREPLAPPAHSLPLCCGEAEKQRRPGRPDAAAVMPSKGGGTPPVDPGAFSAWNASRSKPYGRGLRGKAWFFRLVWAGRRCAAASRFILKKINLSRKRTKPRRAENRRRKNNHQETVTATSVQDVAVFFDPRYGAARAPLAYG